ncbi:protein archease [Candidatus Woesearchaeota archaeon]|nr:protein archease [Candidatus Woesearchaeota archaeon]
MKYKYLEHTADLKFQAFGKSMEEAFANAAIAMFDFVTKTGQIEPKMEEKIEVQSEDNKSLLYDFLEQFLFLIDTKRFLLHEIKDIKIKRVNHEKLKLSATAVGDAADHKYQIGGDIKAVTYNDMFIRKEDDHYVVQVLMDI